MKKLIASAIVAAAIVLPAAPAAAADVDAWWGRKPCDWGEVGTVVWHDTPATDYEEIRLCFPRVGPGVAPADDGPARAGVASCYKLGPGHRGYFVWWYDLDGNYHRTDTCVFIRP